MTTFESQLARAERLSAIAARVGFALWQLQELEGVTAQYFVLIAQAKRGMGLEAGLALTDKAQSKTFGSTVTQLVKAKQLPAEIEDRLQTMLAERNWLVHNSKASNRTAVHDELACKSLLDRLEKIADNALELLKEIGRLAEDFVQSHGVNMAQIDKITNETLREWHNKDAI